MSWMLDALAHGIAENIFEPLRRLLERIAKSETTSPEEVRCSLRSHRVQVHGIPTSWTAGVATVSQGQITFSSRDGSGEPVVVAVASIDPAAPDRTRGTARDARVMIHTDQGILECSMQRAAVDRVRRIVLSRG